MVLNYREEGARMCVNNLKMKINLMKKNYENSMLLFFKILCNWFFLSEIGCTVYYIVKIFIYKFT